MGILRVLSGIANLASNYDCSNPCSFRDMTIFVVFQKIFRKLIIIFFRKIWNSQPCSWVLSEYSQWLRILPPSMTAQFSVVLEIRCFCDFFENFQKTSIMIFSKIWISQPCSWVFSEYYQGLRILRPIMAAQIIVVFEIWRFLWFFQKFSENSNYDYFLKIWSSQPCS